MERKANVCCDGKANLIDFPIRPAPTKNGDRPDGGSLDKYMGHFIKSWTNAGRGQGRLVSAGMEWTREELCSFILIELSDQLRGGLSVCDGL